MPVAYILFIVYSKNLRVTEGVNLAGLYFFQMYSMTGLENDYIHNHYHRCHFIRL